MIKTAVVFFVASFAVGAQTFQPPSWGQGQGSGQGRGSGQGQGTGQGAQTDPINVKIQDLQRQINVLRQQQRRQNSPPVEVQTGPVSGHPVSAKETRHTKQTLGDGSSVDRSDVSYFYRDASGRMRAESPKTVEILDPVGGTRYELSPSKKTYIRGDMTRNPQYMSVAVYGDSTQTSSCGGSGCSGHEKQEGTQEDLGQQMVNGVMAKGSRITITIPVGAIGNDREIKITNERWYSDDLQLLVKSINTDPRFGVNEYELTNISQSPPDPALFVPPSGYTPAPALVH